jgi:Protein of unknown function (DUF3592)
MDPQITVRRPRIAARILFSLVLLALAGFGAFILWHGLRSAAYRIAARSWNPAECVIEASEIADTGGSPRYDFEVRYRYSVDGEERIGQTYRWADQGSDHLADIERLLERFPVGARVGCWVNPDDPSDAALDKPSLWGLLELLVPLVLLGIPIAVLLVWRRLRRSATPSSPLVPSGQESISKAASPTGSGCAAGFFSLFLLAGLGFFSFFAIPAFRVLRAMTWDAVPCEILSSGVESHSGDDGSTYSVEVAYRYDVDGVEHHGDRYEFLGGSSSGYEGKQKIVDALPEGAITTCYVDPDDPYDSVLHRGFAWPYLFGLLPLIFVAVGGGGMYWALTGSRRGAKKAKGRARRAGGSPSDGDGGGFREIESWETPTPAGPIELDEKMSPFGKLAVIIGLALFWNGIVSVFVWQVVASWRSGGGVDGCLTLFLVPFVLVGLLLIVGIPYQILALFNPRPRLRISRGAIPLGGSAQVDWSFKGASGRLSDLRIWVEGAESATYRQGTSTRTDTEVFARIPIVDRQSGMPMDSGSATLEIPEDTMHTFEARHNRILWVLKLHGSIARWPDVDTEFPIKVVPRGGGS